MSNSTEPIQGSPPSEDTPFEAPPGEAPAKAPLDRPVLFVSLSIVILLMLVAVVFPAGFSAITTSVLNGLVANFGWAFVLTATGFVVFALFLAFSKYGRIPLGQDGEKPEYSRASWIAMMFSAGMGIGLMFYGVTEPISHYLTPPVDGITPGTPEAARQAMNYTLFHWAIHPWAIYAVVGLALAYSAFRKGRGAGFSGAFTALFRGRPTPGACGPSTSSPSSPPCSVPRRPSGSASCRSTVDSRRCSAWAACPCRSP